MAAVQGDDGEIFVYMGGDQQVPDGVRRARIHISVKIIRSRAFQNRRHLMSVEFHDGIEIIEENAFACCYSLRGSIKLLGVKIIKEYAFCRCTHLTDVEFGNKLEAIEQSAFNDCFKLKKIKMPSARTIGRYALSHCKELSDVECGEGLRTLKDSVFSNCFKLERIALPLLKGDMIEGSLFYGCDNLIAVDLVGGIHQTVASLHMESWRNEMMDEIISINQTLSTAAAWQKTWKVQQWMVMLPADSITTRLNTIDL